MSERLHARVEIHVTVEMDLDPEWIDRTQTAEWRDNLYSPTRSEAASMIADNLIRNDARIDQLDGWADIEPDIAAEFHRAVKIAWDVEPAVFDRNNA